MNPNDNTRITHAGANPGRLAVMLSMLPSIFAMLLTLGLAATMSAPEVRAQTAANPQDFDNIDVMSRNDTIGIWSDGTTMWVADTHNDYISAWSLLTKQRDTLKEIPDSVLTAAGNGTPRGLWSDGVTMWVSDSSDDKIYAYNLQTKQYDASKDFDTLDAAGNEAPSGMWSNGETMWIADTTDDVIYAYNLATKARDRSKDFRTLDPAGNEAPRGLWSDGETMWVSDSDDDKLFAYNLRTKARDADKDLNTLSAAGNNHPYGIWSDGTVIWAVDFNDEKIYAYNLADGTRVSTLTLNVAADAAEGTVTEGENAVFTVFRSGALGDGVTVSVNVAQEGDFAANTDPVTVTIATNLGSAKFTVGTVDDDAIEDGGSITVTLADSPAMGYTNAAIPSASVNVIDNDGPTVLALSPESVTESLPMEFIVRLSGTSVFTVSVAYATEDGTATSGIVGTAGADYEAVSGILTFLPGQTEHKVEVATWPDKVAEGEESVFLVLSNARNSTLGNERVAALIIEGLTNERYKALNEAILPHVAATVADENTRAIQDRIQAAFSGEEKGSGSASSALQSLADSPLQFLVGVLESGADYTPADMDFTATFGEQGGGGGFFDDVSLWGRGYQRNLSVKDPRVDFSGDITGLMLGLDTQVSNSIYGLAVSHARAELDWEDADFTGTHETELSGLHPYFGWSGPRGIHLWGSLGYEEGDLEIIKHGGVELPYKRDVKMHTAALGGYGALWRRDSAAGAGDLRLNLVADSVYARLEVEHSPLAESEIGTVKVETGWYRAGLELDYGLDLSQGGAFGFSLEVTMRDDYGDARNGNALELSSSFDYVAPGSGLRFDLGYRSLMSSDDDIDEWGVFGGISYAARDDGRGLSLSFTPQWGVVGDSHQRLWEGGFSRLPTVDTADGGQPGALDSSPLLTGHGSMDSPAMLYRLDVKYRLPVLQGRELMTLFARTDMQQGVRSRVLGADLNIGAYFSTGLEVNLDRGSSLGSVYAPSAFPGSTVSGVYGTSRVIALPAASNGRRAYLRYERKF